MALLRQYIVTGLLTELRTTTMIHKRFVRQRCSCYYRWLIVNFTKCTSLRQLFICFLGRYECKEKWSTYTDIIVNYISTRLPLIAKESNFSLGLKLKQPLPCDSLLVCKNVFFGSIALILT